MNSFNSSRKVIHENQRIASENDEDRLFLLSLVKELHKVPADRKLKLKQDIIYIICQAQRMYQQWPQHLQHQTPPSCQPLQSSPVFHYAQQPIVHGGYHHPLHNIPQSSNTTVNSYVYTSTVTSPFWRQQPYVWLIVPSWIVSLPPYCLYLIELYL